MAAEDHFGGFERGALVYDGGLAAQEDGVADLVVVHVFGLVREALGIAARLGEQGAGTGQLFVDGLGDERCGDEER